MKKLKLEIKGIKGDSPTKNELVSLIKPLIPKVKDGKTPTKKELKEIIKPLIKQPKDGKPITPQDVKQKLIEAGGISYTEIIDAPIIEQVIKKATLASKTVSLTELDDIDYSGLSQDSNGKYVLGSGGDPTVWGAITGTLSDQTDLQTALDAKADSSHTHDDRYYTETEVNTLLSGKANTSHTHTASDITDFDTEVSNNTDVSANTSARHNAVTVTDSSEIDLTLVGQDITASLKTGSIDVLKLDSGVQTSLGLADSSLQSSDIGSSIQAHDSQLDSIAGLVPGVEGNLIESNGLGGYQIITPANFITNHSILDTADIGVSVQAHSSILDNTTASFTTADETKLDGIETGATADQVASEVPVTPSGNLSSSDVQAGLQELQGDIDTINSSLGGLTDAVVLKGTWDASTGSFPSSADAGFSYIVSVAGTVDSVSFAVNDRILAITDSASTTTYSGNWHKLDYTDAVLSVNSQTGAVVLDPDDLDDSATTNKFSTSAEKTKLGHISVTQAVDLDTMESDIATNNAKVSNATHTGEVTGSTSLSVDKTAITGKTDVAITASDYIIYSDTSDSGNLKKDTVQGVLDLVSAGDVATDSIWDAKGDLAVGTGSNTAQKLSVGTNGQIIVADSSSATGLKYMNQEINATGGSISYKKEGDILYKIHTFTSNGTFTVSEGAGDIEYAVVGGGGAGGHNYGGGGAGGDVELGTLEVATDDALSVVIGAATARTTSGDGADGNQSSLGAIVALGGEGGKGTGGNGGDNTDFTGGTGNGISSGGGGAGAGENGTNYDAATEKGYGGDGASVTLRGDSEKFAGGGGGVSITYYGQGGEGGGANGGANGVDAEANTGGGGSGCQAGLNEGGAGASGIVIVRYPVSVIATTNTIQKQINTYSPSAGQSLTTTYTEIDGFSTSDNILFTPVSDDSKIRITFVFQEAMENTSQNASIISYQPKIAGVAITQTNHSVRTMETRQELSYIVDSWGAAVQSLITLEAREYNSNNQAQIHLGLWLDGSAPQTNLVDAYCEIEEIG